ncbi:cytochrome b-245 chaperone 1 [Octopus sinensis]|uniref:Essential for reactive oxygen species protein n=1 Tax=Octopus sinensis TaxID=2607531 RepID=A0A6P7SDS8_9MOLL|nr:cytochrome b-245 chaperone 1 [Octopus sinensis]XP_029636488.1 cytochrome b-245 chaperone 1 [Octopus sinensis]XP_029636489.1 cytochrome b-245 chaperone 1 [Octopus sinensis]
MVYMQIKEQTADKLHLCREPNSWSWCLLFGVITGGIGAIYYGSDHFLWKIFWLLGALLLGLTAMEDWEDCIFEKSTGLLTIKKRSLLQRFLHPLLKQHVVKASLDDIVGVRVEEREMKYLGKGNQVVVLLAAGAIIGITESFTIGDSSDHYAIAHKIQDFLEVDLNHHHDPNDGDDYLGDSSSSEDSFEQIGPQYVLPESSSVAANTENMYKM